MKTSTLLQLAGDGLPGAQGPLPVLTWNGREPHENQNTWQRRSWVLAQGEDVAPIPGTKRRSYLEENVAAVEVELSEEDLRRIDEAAPRGIAAGDRYADMSPVSL
jgi:diketogulonate reductase-like aldo/keto reductase